MTLQRILPVLLTMAFAAPAAAATVTYEGAATVVTSSGPEFAAGYSFDYAITYESDLPTTIHYNSGFTRYVQTGALSGLHLGGQAIPSGATDAVVQTWAYGATTYNALFSLTHVAAQLGGYDLVEFSIRHTDDTPTMDPLDFAAHFDPLGNWAETEATLTYRITDGSGQNIYQTLDLALGPINTVPLPAGLPLLIGALLPIALYRRRKT